MRAGGVGTHAKTETNTMQRRNLLIGMGSIAAGGAATIGTGAFTSVQADRSVQVAVADDDEAFLSIEGNDTNNGNQYVTSDGTSGTLTLDFTNTDNEAFTSGGGSGLNDNAETIIRDLFTITNKGTQRVLVRISGMPEGMSAYADDFDGVEDQYEPFGITLNANTNTSNLPRLDPGDALDEVGVTFKTGSRYDGTDELDDFDGTITIEALTNTEAGAPEDEVGSG